MVALKLVVQDAKGNAFHFLAVLGEYGFYPVDYALKIEPQFVCIGFVLVYGHVLLNVVVAKPAYGCFEIILPEGGTRQVIAAHIVGGTVGFAEMFFGIGEPGAGVYGVAQLLVVEFFAGYVDGFKPVELFLVVALAEVNHKFIIEYLVLFHIGKVMDIEGVERKTACHILANAYGALLSVQHFVGIVGIFNPVHYV